MHHALEIQEILSHIFSYCSPPVPSLYLIAFHRKTAPDLAALARTCCAFKEPALDALWKELIDLSPLARCLPEASIQLSPRKVRWFQVFVTLCLMKIFHFSPAILRSSIRLADRLQKPTGISFEVTHVASDPYGTSAVYSTGSSLRPSAQTLLLPSYSSRTSAFCIVNTQGKPCLCYTCLSHP